MGVVSIHALASRYDVVIIGGAAIGSAIAWFLTERDDFDGSVLVIDRDRSWVNSGTARTNSCIRQQFSEPINVAISRFGVEFIANFHALIRPTVTAPLDTDYFGYLYLAGDEGFASELARRAAMQRSMGAATEWLDVDALHARFPFMATEGLIGGTHNPVDEGYFDSGAMVDGLRRSASQRGVVSVEAEVVNVRVDGNAVTAVELASSGTRAVVGAGAVVNAAGTEAAAIASMVGVELPVEARTRYTFVFEAAAPLDRRLPLTIDPSGVHVRSDGAAYMTGVAPIADGPVDPGDFSMDDDIFEDRVWPVLAARIPAFERIKVRSRWAGHYAYNTFDQNAVIGAHPELSDFYFANGFSGHGIQQAPAIGRGISELLAVGRYEALDLSALSIDRLIAGVPLGEQAVI